MNYGLPYKGSKNKLATKIVDVLPPRKHFYDLFCGGCAVTHAAMMTHKWEDFTINDLNWQCPTLFIDALNGKYKDDTRWISREDFFRLKDTDPYVAFVWSFGNNLRDYIYSREIEPLKKAIHYALYFDDYSLAANLGHDLSFIATLKTREDKYSAIRCYFRQHGERIQQQSHEGGGRIRSLSANWGIQRVQHSEAITRMCELANCSQWNERAGLDASLKKKKKRTRTILPRTLHTRTTDYTDKSTKNGRTEYTPCHNHVGGVKSVHLQTITQTSRLSRIA